MCGTMYEDSRKTGDFEDDIEIIDVAELLCEALAAKDGVAVDTPTGADSGASSAAD